ncbi:UvrD/REP helicase [hydrothermal vent metagenome]|uniref:DNA 3'-5' helicase n=1 Tax=hydrothermal vent metagenome TaxID=652676 RepID=A0A3B1DTS5_9ZZZZ
MLKKYLACKAGAGSGKTFALTIRYISLLLLDVNPKEILTLTFTNKAVASMNNKISTTIFTLGDDDIIIDAISKQTNLTKKQIIDKKNTIIGKFTSTTPSIYTIDKFVNKILRQFSGYANINDDFNIETNNEELLLYKFLLSLDKNNFDTLIDFAFIQNKKLHSIMELFNTLNNKNEQYPTISSLNIDLEVITSKILDDAKQIKVFIDSSSLSNSAKNSVDFNDITSLFEKGKTWLSKNNLNEFSYFKKAAMPDKIKAAFDRMKLNISYYYKAQENITLNNLFNIFNNFKKFRSQYNKNKNSLEFNDITNIVYELLSKHIDKDFLYFRLDSHYTNILIDEFQDTSILQYKILEPLVIEIMSGDSDKLKTFFYVGDTKQSIYRFRGGMKELFDAVVDQFSKKIEVEILDTNFRSSKNIVNFVNKNFNSLPNYEYYSQKVKSNTDGLVQVIDFEITEDEPYTQISNKISDLINQGIDINNIAILTYTNLDVLDIYFYLKSIFPKLKITTEITSKLVQEQNVQAIINTIKYLYFKEDIYLANFNALTGEDFFKTWTKDIPFININMGKLIKDIAYNFNIMNDNVIKFIELANSYNNIIDFIYDIDIIDASRVFSDQNGIQILTIFKSKGLEFESVIVLDRIRKKNHDKSSLLFEYNSTNLKHIYLKNKNRESFDKDYKNAIDKEKKLYIDDELNTLYVALTRAKNNMFIFKKNKNSVFDLLGDNCSIQDIGELNTKNNTTNHDKRIVKLDYEPLYLGQQNKKVKNNLVDNYNTRQRYFGIATHYCLEMISDFNIASLDKSIKITKNKFSFILKDECFDDIYNRIQRLIENKIFQNIISGAELFKEQALMFEKKVKILDLLVKKNDHYLICDYKTTVSINDEHKEQVSFYKKAVLNITQSNHIESFIIYLNKNDINIISV